MTRLRAVLLNGAVALLALLVATPVLWMLSVSFMPKGEATGLPPPLLPSAPTLASYRELLLPRAIEGAVWDYHVPAAMLNSLALATITALLTLALTLPAGYAFAKLRFRGRERLLKLLLAAIVVPGQVAMLPLFLMVNEAGLVNSYAGVVLPSLAAIFAVLLVRQSALSVPDEMIDAARLDGASEWQIFRRVVLPLLTPTVVTLALLAFLGSWNDFLWPLIVITDQQLYTLPVAIAAISREHAQDTELMMAGAVVTTMPVLLIFLALQRFYIGGLLGGAIKG